VITFKRHSDLRKLAVDDPARPVMKELVEVLIDDFSEPGQSYFIFISVIGMQIDDFRQAPHKRVQLIAR
jgi:hypothetical protein